MQRVYLDTTVPSAYHDPRAPDRQRLTQEFWDQRLPSYEPLISETHLVKLQIRRQINLVNALLGHGQIEIVSPPEL